MEMVYTLYRVLVIKLGKRASQKFYIVESVENRQVLLNLYKHFIRCS